jgi:glutamine cyclotransferase
MSRVLVTLLWLMLNSSVLGATTYEAVVIKKLPHNRQDFTQGLEIRAGKLYQSTGQYGQSKLQVFNLADGALLRGQRLPRQLFGEGITLLNDKLVQLTWRARIARVYQLPDLRLIEEFPLPGQGWGLTNDGTRLIYSDGSDQLHFLSADNWQLLHSIGVRYQGQPVRHLNELEWTPDYILANIWFSDWVLMIDPATGEVIGRIDLHNLLPADQRRPDTDVLNGIARDPDSGELWVTGKNWPWLYQIELRPKNRLE